MRTRTLLALAVCVSSLGLVTQKASAQEFRAGLYFAAPPVYFEVGPRPGPDYVWVPEFRRWEYRPHYYYRDRAFYRDRDFYRDRERHEYTERHGDRDDRRWDRDDRRWDRDRR